MGRYGEKPDAEGFDSLCPLVLLSGTCLWQDMRNWLGMKHFPLKISGEASSQRSSRFVGMGCVHSSCVCQPAVVCVSQQSMALRWIDLLVAAQWIRFRWVSRGLVGF